jgi:hypothetical protein
VIRPPRVWIPPSTRGRGPARCRPDLPTACGLIALPTSCALSDNTSEPSSSRPRRRPARGDRERDARRFAGRLARSGSSGQARVVVDALDVDLRCARAPRPRGRRGRDGAARHVGEAGGGGGTDESTRAVPAAASVTSSRPSSVRAIWRRDARDALDNPAARSGSRRRLRRTTRAAQKSSKPSE